MSIALNVSGDIHGTGAVEDPGEAPDPLRLLRGGAAGSGEHDGDSGDGGDGDGPDGDCGHVRSPCPHCRAVFHLPPAAPLPGHARPGAHEPFRTRPCPGSGVPPTEGDTGAEDPEDPAGPSLPGGAPVTRLPADLHWRTQPFSHVP